MVHQKNKRKVATQKKASQFKRNKSKFLKEHVKGKKKTPKSHRKTSRSKQLDISNTNFLMDSKSSKISKFSNNLNISKKLLKKTKSKELIDFNIKKSLNLSIQSLELDEIDQPDQNTAQILQNSRKDGGSWVQIGKTMTDKTLKKKWKVVNKDESDLYTEH
jgi:hypothetical protein